MIRILFAWLAAVLATTVCGSLVQSQLALAAIARIHAPVGWQDRLGTYGHDLVHFAPMWAAIIALGFLIAFLVAGWLARARPSWRPLLFPLAGLCAVLVALAVMEVMLPVTVVAAARDGLGLGLLGGSGAVGGAVYVWLAPYRQNGQN
ncbi:MAG: hypothetical protein ACLFSC_03010 [Wenzhouxiangella sp.]